jgi:hypothetical protein
MRELNLSEDVISVLGPYFNKTESERKSPLLCLASLTRPRLVNSSVFVVQHLRGLSSHSIIKANQREIDTFGTSVCLVNGFRQNDTEFVV